MFAIKLTLVSLLLLLASGSVGATPSSKTSLRSLEASSDTIETMCGHLSFSNVTGKLTAAQKTFVDATLVLLLAKHKLQVVSVVVKEDDNQDRKLSRYNNYQPNYYNYQPTYYRYTIDWEGKHHQWRDTYFALFDRRRLSRSPSPLEEDLCKKLRKGPYDVFKNVEDCYISPPE